MLLRGLELHGPLSSDLQYTGIVPVHKFLLTGKFDSQITHTYAGNAKSVTIRRIINTTAAAGNIDVTMADGSRTTFPIAANGELTGLFNQVHAAGTTIAAGSLIADV